jgi:hypothetical protein
MAPVPRSGPPHFAILNFGVEFGAEFFKLGGVEVSDGPALDAILRPAADVKAYIGTSRSRETALAFPGLAKQLFRDLRNALRFEAKFPLEFLKWG